MKGWDFDVAAGKAEPANPRADYADVVAGVPASALVPWSSIFSMPQREAYAVGRDDRAKAVLRWRLGTETAYSKVLLYYAQSAAATGYLFLAEGGKHRPALFAHLYSHYAGEYDPDAVLKAVGCSADELGARIVRWCKSLAPPAK